MIYQTAWYQIKKESIPQVKEAIIEFTKYIKDNEPGTLMYWAWQQKDDPTKLLHFFIFKDKEAQDIHGSSKEVKRFESIYSPQLVSEGVNFIDYDLIGSNQ